MYGAVDLGAGSGRVMLVDLGAERLTLLAAHRFSTAPRRSAGHLRWDFQHLTGEILEGLRAAASQVNEAPRSLGVDSWGVDYGLLDDAGRLIEDPICYRDERTDGIAAAVLARVPDLVRLTGVQVLPFNTIFQLVAHVRKGLPAQARRLLLIPDLVHHWLTGQTFTEETNATTTALCAAHPRVWHDDLFTLLGLPRALMAPLVPPGTCLGPLRSDLMQATGWRTTQVVLPATHDTASAVVGTPLRPGRAFISSGTWSLVGVERGDVLTSDAAVHENFTNEGGAFGTVRFLKNVMGLWLLERCRDDWRKAGVRCELESLLAGAAERPEGGALLYPDDPRLLHPPNMVDAINQQLTETGQRPSDDPVAVTKTILDSLAMRYASVVRRIVRLTGAPVQGVHVVGGGSQNALLNQATATACGLPVLAGPVEATALGNVLVQAIADGRFTDLQQARAYLSHAVPPHRFEPRDTPGQGRAAALYAELEARFT